MFKPIETEVKRLRRYEADRVLSSISIASAWRRSDEKGFAKALASQNLNYLVALRDFQLAFAAKLVLYSYDKARLSPRRFDWKKLLETCRSLAKHQDPGSYQINSEEDLNKFFFRTAYQQFPDFYGDTETFARVHMLFKSCALSVATKSDFDINTAYSEATGLTLEQTWDILLALLGLILEKKGGIQHGPITPGSLKDNIDEKAIKRFLDLVSITPEEYKQKLKQSQYQVDPFETFNPNPLVSWPIITLKENRWVVPIVSYFFRRGTEQMLYDVIAYKGREFAGFFGYVFEEYVKQLLTILEDKYEVIREIRYLRDGKTCDTCDWIIIKDGAAILIECKTKRLQLRTKFTADRELLRNDLTDIGKDGDKNSVVSAIRQLIRTEQDIRQNCSGLEELNKKIVGKIYPLVLVLDPYILSNIPYIRQIIRDELIKGDTNTADYNWQILDIREFESLCAISQKENLVGLIKGKFSIPELQVEDMKTYLDNYCTSKSIDRRVLVHPVLNNEIAVFREDLSKRYKFKTNLN